MKALVFCDFPPVFYSLCKFQTMFKQTPLETVNLFTDAALQFLDRMAVELGLPMKKIEVCVSHAWNFIVVGARPLDMQRSHVLGTIKCHIHGIKSEKSWL